MTLKVFSIQVSGIKCTNCAGKIKKAINTNVQQVKKVTVNVMQERVYATIDD
jgi:copper chaperone CopZ